jgi:hypothetical protein
METHGGAGGEVDFGEVAAVGVENVDCAELVEFDAGELVETVVEVPGGEVDVFGADEVADAGALVALLDLVPPALALIFDHGGFFEEDAWRGGVGCTEEIEEGEVGSGYGSEELPAGEDGGLAGAGADVGEELGGLFAAFEGCSCCACAGEAGVDGGEELFGDGCFGERQEECAVEGAGGALGVGVESAYGFDLVAEEVDSDGTVHLGGVDVEDAAAEGDLAGHLDDVDFGVADGEEVLDEHVGHVLFADFEMEGEGAVVVAGEETHAGGFDGRDDEFGLTCCYLPEGGGAGLLNLGVRGEIFEGKDVVRGEAEDGFGGQGSGELAGAEDGGLEGFGGFVVSDDDDAGSLRSADEEGEVEGTGGEGEPRDTSAPRASAQVAAYTLEGFRVLQVCEELADEG